jgi:UDPglucose 6-dehydrogenase
MKIGIVGFGYVGSAVAASYADDQVKVYDPKYIDMSRSLVEIKNTSDAIFVCVPTPSGPNGCDTSILDKVIKDLSGYSGLVIVKSTAPPQWYVEAEANSKLRLAHVPEFLTQARAKYDYVNPHKIVVGCKPELRDAVTKVLLASAINFDRMHNIEFCSIAEASFFKYMANNMLAMKVIINNEMSQLANAMGLDWATVSLMAKSDSRLGNTHWAVPGPDGNYGFGGACFPKDTEALQVMAREVGVDMTMLDTAVLTNQTLRITTE